MPIDLTRENYIWVVAEVMAERTASTAMAMLKLVQGKTLDSVREFIESLINDPHELRDFLDSDLYLMEGATESDLNLLFDDYLPALLKNQIERLDMIHDSPTLTDDEPPTKTVAARKRKMGFIQ